MAPELKPKQWTLLGSFHLYPLWQSSVEDKISELAPPHPACSPCGLGQMTAFRRALVTRSVKRRPISHARRAQRGARGRQRSVTVTSEGCSLPRPAGTPWPSPGSETAVRALSPLEGGEANHLATGLATGRKAHGDDAG